MYKLKQIYGSTAAFYRQDRGSVVFTAGWGFAGIVVLSFIGSLLFPMQADGIVEQFAQMLQQSGMASDDGNVVFSALLLNNLSAMVMATVYGLLPFIRLPALALGVEPVDEDIMKKPPTDAKKSLFAGGMTYSIAIEGCFIGMISLLAFTIGRVFFDGAGAPAAGRTMAFAVLSCSQPLTSAVRNLSLRSVFSAT